MLLNFGKQGSDQRKAGVGPTQAIVINEVLANKRVTLTLKQPFLAYKSIL